MIAGLVTNTVLADKNSLSHQWQVPQSRRWVTAFQYNGTDKTQQVPKYRPPERITRLQYASSASTEMLARDCLLRVYTLACWHIYEEPSKWGGVPSTASLPVVPTWNGDIFLCLYSLEEKWAWAKSFWTFSIVMIELLKYILIPQTPLSLSVLVFTLSWNSSKTSERVSSH